MWRSVVNTVEGLSMNFTLHFHNKWRWMVSFFVHFLRLVLVLLVFIRSASCLVEEIVAANVKLSIPPPIPLIKNALAIKKDWKQTNDILSWIFHGHFLIKNSFFVSLNLTFFLSTRSSLHYKIVSRCIYKLRIWTMDKQLRHFESNFRFVVF